jgi:hypothetical protein
VGAHKSITLPGTGQSVDIEPQIKTLFTVVGKGCIISHSNSKVTATPGTVLQFDCRAGTGPQPSNGTWKGDSFTTDATHLISCPSTTGTVGQMYLDNTLNEGDDTDTYTVKVGN